MPHDAPRTSPAPDSARRKRTTRGEPFFFSGFAIAEASLARVASSLVGGCDTRRFGGSMSGPRLRIEQLHQVARARVDVAGAESDDQIARLDGLEELARDLLLVGDVANGVVAVGADRPGERVSRRALDGHLARG